MGAERPASRDEKACWRKGIRTWQPVSACRRAPGVFSAKQTHLSDLIWAWDSFLDIGRVQHRDGFGCALGLQLAERVQGPVEAPPDAALVGGELPHRPPPVA